MKRATPNDHKFAALRGAVRSGGSFVHLAIFLKSDFRLNDKGAGRFGHMLIIADEGTRLHFAEGRSASKYNVATLHAGCM